MSVSYESFLSSEIFRLQGPQGRSFFIHGGLLSRKSEVLAVHVNGGMLEAINKEIVIEAVDDDIDDDTVMRFIEYAYTDDYTVPGPDIVLTSNDIGHNRDTKTGSEHHNFNLNLNNKGEDSFQPDPEPEPTFEKVSEISQSAEVDDWAFSLKRASKRKKKNPWRIKEPPPPEEEEAVQDDPFNNRPRESKKSRVWKLFCDQAAKRSTKQWRPQVRSDSNEDFTNVLLYHARLYIFSSRWHCESFCGLILQKLRLTLALYAVTTEKINEIVTLIEFTYSHTHDYTDGVIDALRNLVADFAVCHIEAIEPNKEFRVLLTKENEVGRDFMKKLMKRLC